MLHKSPSITLNGNLIQASPEAFLRPAADYAEPYFEVHVTFVCRLRPSRRERLVEQISIEQPMAIPAKCSTWNEGE